MKTAMLVCMAVLFCPIKHFFHDKFFSKNENRQQDVPGCRLNYFIGLAAQPVRFARAAGSLQQPDSWLEFLPIAQQ